MLHTVPNKLNLQQHSDQRSQLKFISKNLDYKKLSLSLII